MGKQIVCHLPGSNNCYHKEKTVFTPRMEKRRLSLFLQFLFNLNLREGLDDVSYLQVVVVDKRYTALKSCGDFLHIVFVTFQGINRSSVDDNTVTDHTPLVLAVDLALGNHTAGDSPDFGNLEYLLDFHLTGDNLLLHLVEHTDHG